MVDKKELEKITAEIKKIQNRLYASQGWWAYCLQNPEQLEFLEKVRKEREGELPFTQLVDKHSRK